MPELAEKLTLLRAALTAAGLAAIRLRGTDWFAWATCGGSSAVLLTSEVGVAEVLVTADEAWVLTDVIEAERLAAEELPPGLPVWAHAWTTPGERETFVAARTGGGVVASDRPRADERPLPPQVRAARASLSPPELDRYRALGRDAATAMTEVLSCARPGWTGHELAGASAEALWERGIHPALVLVGDERRVVHHRHPTPTHDPIGARVLLVFCARRHGLYANLTRTLYFRPPDPDERRALRQVADIEADALDASRPGTSLASVYAAVVAGYARAGRPGEPARHHQGGPCGYLARDAIAGPDQQLTLALAGAVAWNPSLPGAKIEDTCVVCDDGVEVLTVDPVWPTLLVRGRARPDVLVR